MSNPEHVSLLKQGVKAWNIWRSKNPGTTPDLSDANLLKAELPLANLHRADLRAANLRGADLAGADLYSADLSGANLTGADLAGANLGGADLTRADLTQANLGGADLAGADLCWADLSGANLGGGNLREANLSGADLSGADLSGADLGRAICFGTAFGNVDLSEVRGLERVSHDGPSTIGLDTFFRSKGKIPDAFLRGAGVPDIFIQFAASLVGAAFEFYSCFISYSTKDAALAERLYADLQQKGVRCWFAPEDLKIGDEFRPEIDRAIRVHDKLLLLLSTNSLLSDWVEKEVESAFDRERRDKRAVLFPVRLDDAVMDAEEGWAADIRRARHIGDFTKWKDHDAYQKAFDRLLRDLKSPKPPPAAGESH